MSTSGRSAIASDGAGNPRDDGPDRPSAVRSFVTDGVLYLSGSLVVVASGVVVVAFGSAFAGANLFGLDLLWMLAVWAASVLPFAAVLHPLLWWFTRRGWSRGHLIAVTPLLTLAVAIVLAIAVPLFFPSDSGDFGLTMLVAAFPAMCATTIITAVVIVFGRRHPRTLLAAGAVLAILAVVGWFVR
ncbi:hypothetical protein [Plantibacter sp. YIM 135347]|uniref:hypothetical protein n=1 Tax=Plantibacter sp. YIM 135347 TaxID=3423919 RepID=UPI003D3394C6